MWAIFSIELVTTLLLFYVLVFWPQGMWDLISLTRDRTCAPCTGSTESYPLDCQGSPISIVLNHAACGSFYDSPNWRIQNLQRTQGTSSRWWQCPSSLDFRREDWMGGLAVLRKVSLSSGPWQQHRCLTYSILHPAQLSLRTPIILLVQSCT